MPKSARPRRTAWVRWSRLRPCSLCLRSVRTASLVPRPRCPRTSLICSTLSHVLHAHASLSLCGYAATVYVAMEGQKNPKVATEALRWIETTLPEFGLAGVRVRDLIGFLKAQLESANVTVRQRSTAVLVVLRVAVGPGPSSVRGGVHDRRIAKLLDERGSGMASDCVCSIETEERWPAWY